MNFVFKIISEIEFEEFARPLEEFLQGLITQLSATTVLFLSHRSSVSFFVVYRKELDAKKRAAQDRKDGDENSPENDVCVLYHF